MCCAEGAKKKQDLFFLVPTLYSMLHLEVHGLTQLFSTGRVYLSIVHIRTKLYVDRRNVDPFVSGTSGGAQRRSSWEGGAVGAARRRRAAPKAQYRPKAGKKKKTREEGLFFLVPTSQVVMLHHEVG